MKLTINSENRETVHTYIAITLLVVGFIFAGMGFFTDPIGEISSSVLGFVGECFVFAGLLLGIVQYVNGTLTSFKSELKKEAQ